MKWQAIIHPILPTLDKGHFVFAIILSVARFLFQNTALGYVLLSISLLIVQAFYLNFIVVKHKLFTQNAFLPAFSFLLFTSFFPNQNYLSEAMIESFFVLAAIDIILGLSHVVNPRTAIFNAGFFMSIPLLFQSSGIGFLLLFFVSLAMLRPFQIAEWVVGIIGFFTPIYFFVCLLFLFDKMEVLHQFPLFGINYLQAHDFKGLHLILLLGFFILIGTGLFALQQNLPRFTIYVRRGWLVMVSYCIIAFAIIFLCAPSSFQGWILLMPPLTMIISQSFCLDKPKRFSSFTFYFTILLFIFSQLI